MHDLDREPGYIKLYRQSLSSAIWKNIHDWRLAETLLLRANWKPGTFQSRGGEVLEIQRGELVTSLESLSKASGLSVRNVRTSLEHLKKAEFLTSRTTNHFRKISVVNYERYQEIDKHSDKDPTSTRQRYKKGKKVKNTTEGADTTSIQANGLNGNGLPGQKPLVASPPNSAPSPSMFGPTELVSRWNAVAKSLGLPEVEKLTPERNRKAEARLKEEPAPEYWERALEALKASGFLRGENDRRWRANFDWFIRPDKTVKLIEGQYGNNNGGQRNGAEHLYS